MSRILPIVLLFVTCAALAPVSGGAAPRFIADSRLSELIGVPVLGRGYDLRANSLSATCFSKVVASEPTFDIRFDVEDVSSSSSEVLARIDSGVKREHVRDFLDDHAAGRDKERHSLFVHLSMDGYHRSLDESASSVDPSALELLKNGRFADFFTDCGLHYIRSINTSSSFVALLQYRTSDDAKLDASFQRSLRSSLGGTHDPETLRELKREARGRDLRIHVRGIGLAGSRSDKLVPLDLEQLRDAIRDASSRMQDPAAGVVTGMEVVAWTGNPTVDTLISTGTKDVAGSFARMHRLEANASVLSAIEHSRQLLVDEYDRAHRCEAMLARELAGPPSPPLDREKTLFAGPELDDEGSWISLEQFARNLREKPASAMRAELRQFLDGSAGRPGALACVDALHEKDLREADAERTPACKEILEYEPPRSRFHADYCPPRAVKRILRNPSR